MAYTTKNFGFPLVIPSQSEKEKTICEAIEGIDEVLFAICQLLNIVIDDIPAKLTPPQAKDEQHG